MALKARYEGNIQAETAIVTVGADKVESNFDILIYNPNAAATTVQVKIGDRVYYKLDLAAESTWELRISQKYGAAKTIKVHPGAGAGGVNVTATSIEDAA